MTAPVVIEWKGAKYVRETSPQYALGTCNGCAFADTGCAEACRQCDLQFRFVASACRHGLSTHCALCLNDGGAA